MAFGFTSGGLAGAFGHPEVSQFIDPRRNMLLGLAAGLVGGPNWSQGLSSGFQMAAQGGAVDRAAAEKAKADELAAKQTAAARTWFEKNAPQYVPLLDAGMSTGDAWNRYFQGQNSEAVNPYMNIGGGKVFNWQTGEYIADPNAQPDAPSAYQWSNGQLAPIPGGPADPNNPLNMKRVGQGPMSPTTQKELFEAEDVVNSGAFVVDALDQALTLNASAFDGPMADIRGDTSALFGNEGGVATAQLKNLTTELALNQLKATFGAAPTEGERQILMELQGSVNQPKKVREKIFKRAKELALRRIEINKQKAEALRTGDYFEPGFSSGEPAQVDDILSKYGL